jgi:hypothetical protein
MATTPALAVHTAFGAYVRGAIITAEADIEKVLASTEKRFVHKVNLPVVAPEAPAPHVPTVEEAVAKGVADAEAVLHPATA